MKFLLSDPTSILIAAEEYFQSNAVRYNREILKNYILTKIIHCKENIEQAFGYNKTMYVHGWGGARQTVTWQTIRRWLDKYDETNQAGRN